MQWRYPVKQNDYMIAFQRMAPTCVCKSGAEVLVEMVEQNKIGLCCQEMECVKLCSER